MGKIASLNDLKSNFSVGEGGSKCPTKSEIVALGLTVSGSYSDNQLVQLSDISKLNPPRIRLHVNVHSDKLEDISLYFSIEISSSNMTYSYDSKLIDNVLTNMGDIILYDTYLDKEWIGKTITSINIKIENIDKKELTSYISYNLNGSNQSLPIRLSADDILDIYSSIDA